MKSFNTYISDDNINESLLLACLTGYFVSWGIRNTFKAAEGIRDESETLTFIWQTLFENNMNNEKPLLEEEGEPKKKIKLTKDKIKPIQIPDDKILRQAIEATKPSLSKDGKSGTGLYTIAGKIKENDDFGHIDKKPYYINYAAFVTEDKQICGMFGFSNKFWLATLKKSDNEDIKKLAKKYQKALHIFDMQICPEFEEDVIYDVVWETFEKMIKELKISTITIHYDDKNELDIYKKHGFEEIEGSKEYLVLKKNKK